MAPCEDRDGCPTYQAAGPYRTAIEVFQGDLDDLGITEGATVTVGRCLRGPLLRHCHRAGVGSDVCTHTTHRYALPAN